MRRGQKKTAAVETKPRKTRATREPAESSGGLRALASSGTVPVSVLEPFGNYLAGDVVRFSPSDASRWMDAGLVEPAKVKAATVAAELPENPSLLSPRILPRPLPIIPEDWQDMHILVAAQAGRHISGGPAGR